MKNIQIGDTIQYLFFKLDNEKYAIEASDVQEVVDFKNITRVPNSNECIKGVTNIRGELIAVVDPLMRFCGQETQLSKRTSFVILRVLNKTKEKKHSVAIMVDLVLEVEDIQISNILDVPDFGTKIEKEFIKNIIKYNEEYISVLKIDTILDLDT